tara:strand:- start:4434 stop:5294 length:861 start_codon:yes stop_codon:yes gene_type:complete
MISIIIPTYNRAHSIFNSIESVLNQTDPNWQLLIIDDGSKDNTHEIVDKYLKDERIQYHYDVNKGVSAARNRGARLSKGTYLIFLDSDDMLETELIENLNKSNFSKYDLICWELKCIIDGEVKIIKPKIQGILYNNYKVGFLAESICYNKQFFLKVGGYDEKMTFGENYELGIRLCQEKKLKILILNEILARYYIESTLRTSNSMNNRFYSGVHQYKKHRDLFKSSRHENSKMLYFLGYLLENLKRKSFAFKFYSQSWFSAPWKIKPLFKMIIIGFSLSNKSKMIN